MSEPVSVPKLSPIVTNRLILRPFRDTDAADAIRVLTNTRCAETYMLPDFPSPEDARPLFERLLRLSQGTDRLVAAVSLRDGDRVIGFLNETERKGNVIELGYVLHPDFWNRGYMTEALHTLIGWLFRAGFDAVRAGYFEENAPSGRVMEKCGMTLTGESEEIEYRSRTHRCVYREIRQTGRMGKAVIVVPSDPRWKEDFAFLRDRIMAAAGAYFCAVEHIGSTSIEGLSAKPIVDIDAVIPDPSVLPAVRDALAGIGYEYEGDRGIPGREAFRYIGREILPKHNLYVCPADSPELRRHLALRDRLREHPDEAEEYGRVKRRAAAEFPYEIDRYIEAKTPFIESVYRSADLLPPCVRPARSDDAERIAEILVFCYRLNFYPIFRNDGFYFGEMRVDRIAARLGEDPGFPDRFLVYDDGVVKGYAEVCGDELVKLFVEPCCQGYGIGGALLRDLLREHGVRALWALEKNVRAIRFYERHGFARTGERKPEDGTEEYLVRMTLAEDRVQQSP